MAKKREIDEVLDAAFEGREIEEDVRRRTLPPLKARPYRRGERRYAVNLTMSLQAADALDRLAAAAGVVRGHIIDDLVMAEARRKLKEYRDE